jgi:hypothetical protein
MISSGTIIIIVVAAVCCVQKNYTPVFVYAAVIYAGAKMHVQYNSGKYDNIH